MKKQKGEQEREPTTGTKPPRPEAPSSNPSTGQIISPVVPQPYIPKGKARKKDPESITIAPTTPQGPDVL